MTTISTLTTAPDVVFNNLHPIAKTLAKNIAKNIAKAMVLQAWNTREGI